MKKAVLLMSLLALIVVAPNMSPAQNTVSLIQNGDLNDWWNGAPVGWNLIQQDGSGNAGGSSTVVESGDTPGGSGSSLAVTAGGGFTFRYVAHTSSWGPQAGDVDWSFDLKGAEASNFLRCYIQIQTGGTGVWATDFSGTYGAAGNIGGAGHVPETWTNYNGTWSAGAFPAGDRYRLAIHAIATGFVDNVSITTAAPYADCGGPYAGLIGISDNSVIENYDTDIEYYLPYDLNTTGTVTIDIVSATETIVASFAGTTDPGLNTVTWDGTDDNAGGTNIPAGSDYQIRITVENHVLSGWYESAFNESALTLFSGFSPTGSMTQYNQGSELFGLIYSRGGWSGVPYSASVLLTPDLEPQTGDGLAARVLRNSTAETNLGSINGGVWGGDFHPSSNQVNVVGQAYVYNLTGNGLDTNLASSLNGFSNLTFGRDCQVVKEGDQLWQYTTGASSVIDKVRIGSDGLMTTDSLNVLSPASLGSTIYSKDLEFDEEGNMYWTSRDGFVYRWDAADVQAIQKPGDAPLTGGQASWVITMGGTNSRTMGSAISCGKLYTVAVNAATETDADIFLIGDTSTASLTKTVTDGDIVVDVSAVATNISTDGIYGNLDTDPGGHLLTDERSSEEIFMFSPGGHTVITTLASDAELFSFGPAPAVDLVITEILDGPVTGGLPKFFEITNVGSTDIVLDDLVEVAREANADTTYTFITPLTGTIPAGGSYIVSQESTVFNNVFGFDPDIVSSAANNNGDDRIAILHFGTGATTPIEIDLYGVPDTDGTGSNWEYLDTRVYRLGQATPNGGTFSVSDFHPGVINDNDGGTTPPLARYANPGAFDNEILFTQQIGIGGDLDEPTTPVLTNAPSALDVLNGVTVTVGDNGLHGSGSGGVAVFTDGVDVGANGGDGLLFDANGNGLPTSINIDWFADAGIANVSITDINMWSRNAGLDARAYINCHIYLDTTNDWVFNPTFYGEVTTGNAGDVNTTDDWTAAYVADSSGSGYLGDAATYGVRLDFYSVTNATTGYRSEDNAAGGSIIKEIDIFGDAVTPPTSVDNWIIHE